MGSVRLDKFLWAIRIFRTRTRAARACDQGWVRDKDNQVLKAAHKVKPGEILEIRSPQKRWKLEVREAIDQRRSFTQIQSAYIDRSGELPPPPSRYHHGFETGKRQSKTGKPTRKQREALEDWKNFPFEENQ